MQVIGAQGMRGAGSFGVPRLTVRHCEGCADVEAAQKAFYRRAKFNGAARSGSYAPEMEREAFSAA